MTKISVSGLRVRPKRGLKDAERACLSLGRPAVGEYWFRESTMTAAAAADLRKAGAGKFGNPWPRLTA